MSTTEKNMDGPVERRVAELRFIRRPEEAEELEFLEEYLRWKADGGAQKLDEKRDADRRRAWVDIRE